MKILTNNSYKIFIVILWVLLFFACQKGPNINENQEIVKAYITYKLIAQQQNTFQFINQSVHATTVMWDMGNGIKYAGKDSLIYQYSKKGTYTLSLYALGASGTIDSTSTNINVAQDFNPMAILLSGNNSKTWKLTPHAKALVIGPLPPQTCCPTIGDPPSFANNWWANSDADILTRACTFNTTYTFNANATMTRDIKGSFWPDPNLSGYPSTITCLDATTYWTGSASAFANQNFTWDINTITKELTINGLGAYIGLHKVQELGEANETIQPISKIIYKIYSLTSNQIIIYKDVPNGGIANGARWYFTLDAI